jgi:deoxyribonuclease II
MVEAKNQYGEAVDWWFIYKTPEHSGNEHNQGFDFLYYDPDSAGLVLSPVGLDQADQALAYSLNGIFNAPDNVGYLVYNDEHADAEENSSEKGHCKGILAFDKTSDSALLLLHSTPRFPANHESTLPDKEQIYGQTFICVSLPDYQSANQIAEQMLQQQNPQILKASSRVPASVHTDEAISRLFHGIGINESKQPATLRFKSRAGKAFLLIAKSRKWGEDFWLDLVSPELNCDLVVETWRRGAVTPLQDGRSTDFDEDLLNIDFRLAPSLDYQWRYTHDHAKWAVSLNNASCSQPWVCVADLNRMLSQEKRGGASLCFQEPKLWEALKNAEQKLHQIAKQSD